MTDKRNYILEVCDCIIEVYKMAGVQKKSVQLDVLVWRLAEGFSSPDDSDGSDGNVLTWRLAAKSFPPGDSCNISGLLECVCLAVWVVPPGGVYND